MRYRLTTHRVDLLSIAGYHDDEDEALAKGPLPPRRSSGAAGLRTPNSLYSEQPWWRRVVFAITDHSSLILFFGTRIITPLTNDDKCGGRYYNNDELDNYLLSRLGLLISLAGSKI